MERDWNKLPKRILLAGFFIEEAKRNFFFGPARLLRKRGVTVSVLEHGRGVDHDLPAVYAPSHLFRQPTPKARSWRPLLLALGFALRHPRTCFNCICIDFLVIGKEKRYAGNVWRQWVAILRGLMSAVWQIANDINPDKGDLAICFGSNHPWQRLFRIVCARRGVKLIFAEYGALHGFLHFSETSVSYGMFPIRFRERFLSLALSDRDIFLARRYIKFNRENDYEIREQVEDVALLGVLEKRPEKKLFLPAIGLLGGGFHPPSSEESKRVSPHFRTNEEVAATVVSIAERKGWLVVYKSHPNSPPTKQALLDSPSLVECGECHVPSIVDRCDAVVCLGTKVSQTALIRGKPVVMLGNYSLSGMGVCYDYQSGQSLEELIELALERGLTEEQRERYVRYVARELRYLLFAFKTIPGEENWKNREEAFERLLMFYASRIDVFPFEKDARA